METAFLINGLLSSIISARALLDGNWHNIDDLVVALHAEKAPLIEAYQFIERARDISKIQRACVLTMGFIKVYTVGVKNRDFNCFYI
jgi:hypothetical protein